MAKTIAVIKADFPYQKQSITLSDIINYLKEQEA